MTEALRAHIRLLETPLPRRRHEWQFREDEETKRREYLTQERETILQYQRRYYKENRERILARRRIREGK